MVTNFCKEFGERGIKSDPLQDHQSCYVKGEGAK